MVQKVNRSGAVGIAGFFAVSLLAGCGQTAEAPQQLPVIAKEKAEMRNEVPLTRSLKLDRAGELASVEFDLPAAGPNAASDLMVGLRIASRDGDAALALSDSLIRAGLAANVKLARIEDGKAVPVALLRNSPDLRERLAVAVDGAVPGVTSTGVDNSMLQDAGLIDPSMSYDVLMFALAINVQPGHYRLSIELTKPHLQSQEENVQLLVAYMRKGK